MNHCCLKSRNCRRRSIDDYEIKYARLAEDYATALKSEKDVALFGRQNRGYSCFMVLA
jgi:hypothetical protein